MGTFRTSNYEQQYLHAMFGNKGEGWDAWKELQESHPELGELYDPKNFASKAIYYAPSGLSGLNEADYYEGNKTYMRHI